MPDTTDQPVCIEPGCTAQADAERPLQADGSADPVVELVCHDHSVQ